LNGLSGGAFACEVSVQYAYLYCDTWIDLLAHIPAGAAASAYAAGSAGAQGMGRSHGSSGPRFTTSQSSAFGYGVSAAAAAAAAGGTADGVGLRDPHQGATRHVTRNVREVLRLLHAGFSRKITAFTSMNANSSRGHTVFQVTVTSFRTGPGGVRTAASSSTLTFFDLAGSERLATTASASESFDAQRVHESRYINKSLAALGQVLSAVATASIQRTRQERRAALQAERDSLYAEGHLEAAAAVEASLGTPSFDQQQQAPTFVPWRSSKLTHYLQSCMGGSGSAPCSLTLLLCLAPSDANIQESVSTCVFGSRARAMAEAVAGDTALASSLLRDTTYRTHMEPVGAPLSASASSSASVAGGVASGDVEVDAVIDRQRTQIGALTLQYERLASAHTEALRKLQKLQEDKHNPAVQSDASFRETRSESVAASKSGSQTFETFVTSPPRQRLVNTNRQTRTDFDAVGSYSAASSANMHSSAVQNNVDAAAQSLTAAMSPNRRDNSAASGFHQSMFSKSAGYPVDRSTILSPPRLTAAGSASSMITLPRQSDRARNLSVQYQESPLTVDKLGFATRYAQPMQQRTTAEAENHLSKAQYLSIRGQEPTVPSTHAGAFSAHVEEALPLSSSSAYGTGFRGTVPELTDSTSSTMQRTNVNSIEAAKAALERAKTVMTKLQTHTAAKPLLARSGAFAAPVPSLSMFALSSETQSPHPFAFETIKDRTATAAATAPALPPPVPNAHIRRDSLEQAPLSRTNFLPVYLPAPIGGKQKITSGTPRQDDDVPSVAPAVANESAPEPALDTSQLTSKESVKSASTPAVTSGPSDIPRSRSGTLTTTIPSSPATIPLSRPLSSSSLQLALGSPTPTPTPAVMRSPTPAKLLIDPKLEVLAPAVPSIVTGAIVPTAAPPKRPSTVTLLLAPLNKSSAEVKEGQTAVPTEIEADKKVEKENKSSSRQRKRGRKEKHSRNHRNRRSSSSSSYSSATSSFSESTSGSDTSYSSSDRHRDKRHSSRHRGRSQSRSRRVNQGATFGYDVGSSSGAAQGQMNFTNPFSGSGMNLNAGMFNTINNQGNTAMGQASFQNEMYQQQGMGYAQDVSSQFGNNFGPSQTGQMYHQQRFFPPTPVHFAQPQDHGFSGQGNAAVSPGHVDRRGGETIGRDDPSRAAANIASMTAAQNSAVKPMGPLGFAFMRDAATPMRPAIPNLATNALNSALRTVTAAGDAGTPAGRSAAGGTNSSTFDGQSDELTAALLSTKAALAQALAAINSTATGSLSPLGGRGAEVLKPLFAPSSPLPVSNLALGGPASPQLTPQLLAQFQQHQQQQVLNAHSAPAATHTTVSAEGTATPAPAAPPARPPAASAPKAAGPPPARAPPPGRPGATSPSPAAAPTPPAAAGTWTKHVDKASGRPYWYNKTTKKTTWNDPEKTSPAPAAAPPAAPKPSAPPARPSPAGAVSPAPPGAKPASAPPSRPKPPARGPIAEPPKQKESAADSADNGQASRRASVSSANSDGAAKTKPPPRKASVPATETATTSDEAGAQEAQYTAAPAAASENDVAIASHSNNLPEQQSFSVPTTLTEDFQGFPDIYTAANAFPELVQLAANGIPVDPTILALAADAYHALYGGGAVSGMEEAAVMPLDAMDGLPGWDAPQTMSWPQQGQQYAYNMHGDDALITAPVPPPSLAPANMPMVASAPSPGVHSVASSRNKSFARSPYQVPAPFNGQPPRYEY
jgi:hypothetical protein